MKMDLIKLLDKDPESWNKWRDENPSIRPDFSRADLSDRDLSLRDFHYVNFTHTKLIGANLSDCNLASADLSSAQLQSSTINRTLAEWANFSDACLDDATLMGSSFEKAQMERTSMLKVNAARSSFEMAILDMADLTEAYLSSTSFLGACLRGAVLSNARLGLTVFVDTNLYGAVRLESCMHGTFSYIDHRTLAQSGKVNFDFMKACGVPESLIRHYPNLVKGTIRYMDCFISCSEADIEFAELLYRNLEGSGVNCWLYKHDMPWGARQWDSIDSAITENDKLILVLSKDSIQSEWVEDEITKAFAEERQRKKDILLPLRLDDAVMTSSEPWASKVKNSRNIADFQHWRNSEQYRNLLHQLLDLLLKPNPKYK